MKQGDLLFEIDPRPLRNTLQSAEADRQKIQVQLENARTQVAQLRPEPRPDLLQEQIAARMADGVVHFFEAVEVEQQHCY